MMDRKNTHTKVIDLPGGGRAILSGVPDACKHELGGDWYCTVSPLRNDEKFEHGWSYLIKAKTIQRMRPDVSEHEAIKCYDEDIRGSGHYISGGCTSCKKCGKPTTPPFW